MIDGTISLLGCGWLGLPLGTRLVDRGFRVKGSTTTPAKRPALRRAGIQDFLIYLDPDLRHAGAEEFFRADVLFLNIPPSRQRPDVRAYYEQQVQTACNAATAHGVTWILLASSTSVYPDLNRTVTEEDARPTNDTAAALLAAEATVRASAADATIIRYGGLYGYDRQPGRFLAGRTNVPDGGAPVNLIHRDDAVDIVLEVLAQEARGEVFNACTDAHPDRKTFYTREAARLGLDPPTFSDEAASYYKVVSNQKLKQHLNYSFRHPDPLDEAP